MILTASPERVMPATAVPRPSSNARAVNDIVYSRLTSEAEIDMVSEADEEEHTFTSEGKGVVKVGGEFC